MASKYLASQFSGSLAQSVIGAQEYDYAQKDFALNYYKYISIDSIENGDLANLGLWIGMPWPTASASLFNDNKFTFGSSSTFPNVNNMIGFGTVSYTSIGGLFDSTTPSDNTYIPINKYRSLLKWYACFKRNGFTIESLDKVANIFSNSYTIGYATGVPWDIELHFTETIGNGNVHVLQYLFDKILDVQRVVVSQII